MAVALYGGPVGGAAKANRWAALTLIHRAEQTRQPERSRITTHRWVSPDITGHIRAYPGIFRHFRTRKNHRVPSRPSPVMPSHTACRVRYDLSPDRVPSGSSHTVSFVVGHGVEKGHRVPYRPSPDRVPYGPSRAVSPVAGHRRVRDGRRVPYMARRRIAYPMARRPDHVSSCPGPCRRPRCACRGHGRASRTPVTRHVPAQQRL